MEGKKKGSRLKLDDCEKVGEGVGFQEEEILGQWWESRAVELT
jgi:hypothetical protein